MRNAKRFGALTALLTVAVFSTAARTPTNGAAAFRAEMKEELTDLSKELDQFQSKQKSIPAEQKAAFTTDVRNMKKEWSDLNDAVAGIKTRLTAKQKSHISTRVSALEHNLDKAESSYGDKHLGLGELLGF